MTPTRVLVVDDHRMFLDSLVRLLGDEDDLEIVGVATDAETAIALAEEHQPDVVVLDYILPGRSGTAAIDGLRAVAPAVEIVVLTGYADDAALVVAIEAGCSGFVTKDEAADDLVHIVREVAAGKATIPAARIAALSSGLRPPARTLGRDLTGREREVLGLIAAGLGTDAIASTLFVSRNTVRNHTQRLLGKLGAHSRLEAVAIAIRAGLVHSPPK